MFQTVLDLSNHLRRPSAKKGEQERLPDYWSVADYLLEYPLMLGELMAAVKKSENRMKSLPKASPERVIEENFPALQDVSKFRKLAEALPNYSGDLAQIRTRIS